MFCPKCGTSLEDNAVFCSECGARIRETGATVPGNAAAAGSNGKSPSVKKKFPVKTAAILSGLLVLIIAVTVIIGSAVSSARPENIAADYLKNYYNGEIKKADKDCIVTMRDQWELSIEKYHNGNKKAYFMFLTSSYESNVTSFSSAYKALDKMTHKRFSDYYGESYTVEVTKKEKLDVSDSDAAIALNLLAASDYISGTIDTSELSGNVVKYRVTVFIDGNEEGKTTSNDITLVEYNGKWKVLNPMVFGW